MKEVRLNVRDIIIVGLILVIAFYFALEIYKIKHQLKFAVTIEQVTQNTAWIRNFNLQVQQAQQRALQQQQAPQLEKVPESEKK